MRAKGQEMTKTNSNIEQLDEEGLLALADERYDAEDYENAFIYYKQAADRFGGDTLLGSVSQVHCASPFLT